MPLAQSFKILLQHFASRQPELKPGSWLSGEAMRLRREVEKMYFSGFTLDQLLTLQSILKAKDNRNSTLNNLIRSLQDEKESTN